MNEGGFLIKEDFADRLFMFQRSKERNRIINTFKIPNSIIKKIEGKVDRVYGRRILNQFLITLSMDLSTYDLPSL